jgi:YD repeat-containing protein
MRYYQQKKSREAPMPAVGSTAIQRIDYDAAARVLSVTFAGGNAYKYYHVPRSVYESFLHADSKGLFFNTYIRDRYDFALASAA